VDGDGELDVAVGGTIHLGGGKGAFGKAATVNAAMIAHLGDLDGDGRLDLVTHDRSGGLRLYLGDGTGKGWKLDAKAGLPDAATFPKGGPVSDKLYKVYGLDVADLDGNGRLDIARVVVASKSSFLTGAYAAYLEAWVR
jgi:hypothetical protein